MLIKPCKFLFSKTHEMVKYTPTNYALRIMHYELNHFRLASVDTPSLLHRISIVTPSKRWTIYGVSMEYVWSILGRKWGERWPLPRKEEAREPTKMSAKQQRKLIYIFFAFRLPPYGGKSDVDNIGVCAKRGERPLFLVLSSSNYPPFFLTMIKK